MEHSQATTRGRDARTPQQIPKPGWRDVVLRTKDEVTADHVSIVAAGVAFFGLLALFPAIASLMALVAKRFVKKQQMRWSRTGAHYLLKVRAAILNGDLPERTQYVPPETDRSPYVASLLNPTPPLLKAA